MAFAQSFGDEIYMNTSLHAEQKINTPRCPVKYIPEKGKDRLSVTFKDDEASGPFPEEHYMVPPSAAAEVSTSAAGDQPILPKSDQTAVTTEEGQEFSPGLYDAPPPVIDPGHATLPPLPPRASDGLSFMSNKNTSQNENEECFYEGINDGDIDCLYEGIPNEEDNFYEGVGSPINDQIYEGIGSPMNDLYEGLDDNEGNDIYDGITGENEVFYEGLGDIFEVNDAKEDESLLNLIHSLAKTDTPYVPPKPPPVPLRNPSKTFKPLPDIPQNQEIRTFHLPKKSPSLQGLTFNYSPLPKVADYNISKSKSLVDMTSRRSSASPKVSSATSIESDGLYDGIDMDSTDEEDQESTKTKDQAMSDSEEQEVNEERSFSRTYSLKVSTCKLNCVISR